MLCFTLQIHVFRNMTEQPRLQFQKGSNYARKKTSAGLSSKTCWLIMLKPGIVECLRDLWWHGWTSTVRQTTRQEFLLSCECEDPQQVRRKFVWNEPNHLLVKGAEDLWEVNLRSQRWDMNTDWTWSWVREEWADFGGQWLHRGGTKGLSDTLNVCVELSWVDLRWDHKLADWEEHTWRLKDKRLGWGEGDLKGAMKGKRGGCICLSGFVDTIQ